MSRKTLEIARVVIESTKPMDDIRASLETKPMLSIYRVGERNASVVQFEVGNALTALITHYAPVAALYLPLRVILYETNDGSSRLEYDLPSSLFGQLGDADRIASLARELDVELGRVLSAAAG